ncbi:MAG: metallophosphoesterase [Parcubacteria group bacterium]|nr:metallophosphoesterase [Parcubacteria group bacterium]
MTILVIADRTPQRPIPDIVSEQPLDLIMTLGDLDLAGIRALESIAAIPKIGVYGNHCSGQYMDQLGIRNMHLQTWSHGGLTFGGFEGSVRYKPSPYAKMYTQDEATAMLKDFPRVDVMLTHCPPRGINDDPSELAHTGFEAMRTYLQEKPPAYWFHGHTYPSEQALITQQGDTKIVYVYGHKIVTI